MSCGQYPHPVDELPHVHHEDAPCGDEDVTPGAEIAPAAPGVARKIWDAKKTVIKPYLYAPAADATALSVHFAAHGRLHAVIASICAGLVAEAVTEVRNWQAKRTPVIRTGTRKAVTAATAWGLLASAVAPVGPYGIVQWALLGTGAAWAKTHNSRMRRPAEAPEETPEPAARVPAAIEAPPDPRLDAFRRRFCEGAQAPLRDAWAGGFRPLPRGFSMEVTFGPDSAHTITTVTGLIPLIAKLYDTSIDSVSVGYVPEHRSEARALVVVHERISAEAAKAARVRWDGKSTYDSARGTVRIGGFTDENRTNFLMHAPRSGAAFSMIAGIMGSGKTAAMHRLAAEAGLMAHCTACGPARTCEACDLRRICAVLVGDAQTQSMAVWKGKADLFGSGPEGCLELFQFLKTVADDRSAVLDGLKWSDTGPDGRVRHNTGKGWFDPAIGFPLIFAPISEFPLLVNHPDKAIGKEAVALTFDAATTWRKVGVHLCPDGQFVDMGQMGEREFRDAARMFNLLAFRLDKTGSSMVSIKGDPTRLPPGEKGAGYIAGVDDRSDTKFLTDWFPEYAEDGDTGVDVRHMAEVISRTPVELDSSMTRAMEAFDLTRQQVITEWKGRGDTEGDAEPAGGPDAPKGPGLYGLPFRDDAEAVKKALGENPGAGIHRLMEVTGLPLGPVDQSLDVLIHNQEAVRTGEDAYTAA
jgi:hypothetical protein